MSVVQQVRGMGRTVTLTLTRPNDTTIYTAGDAISDSTTTPTVLTFSNATKDSAPGFAFLRGVAVIDGANQTLKPDLELWLFDSPPAATNDNAAWAPTTADLNNLIGIVTIPVASFKVANTGAGAAGNVAQEVGSLTIPLATKGGVQRNAVFGQLVVRNAYVPVAQETFTIRLKVVD